MASDAIDTAVLNRLSGDATLTALLTGGIHELWEETAGGLTEPYALVTLFTAKDVEELRRRAWEECRYLVTVHADLSVTSISTVRQACARIDVLLDGATFAISGYTLLKSERERRFSGLIQLDEFDSLDFFSAGFGGLYMIWAQAN
jgi:hypothetical protein